MGCGQPGGEAGFNIARVVAVELGYDFLPGATVNRYCSSSLQTTRMAFHAIKAGEGDAFISAGVETVSRFAQGHRRRLARHQEPAVRRGRGAHRARPPRGADDVARPARGRPAARRLHRDGPDRRERRALYTGISREDQDHWGVRSQNRAEEAIKSGFFAREIIAGDAARRHRRLAPTTARAPAPPTRRSASSSRCSGPNGTVTAGNACPLNDGAAAVVIMSDAKAKELGLTPLARIVATGVSGLSPEIMGLGPIEAVKKALGYAGMSIADIDLFEINEAFAAQVLGSARELGIDEDKLNVSGGAIALGHPFGMTGARITATLLNNLRPTTRRSASRRCASAAARAWRWSSSGSPNRIDSAHRSCFGDFAISAQSRCA